jgi:hypothetical protein
MMYQCNDFDISICWGDTKRVRMLFGMPGSDLASSTDASQNRVTGVVGFFCLERSFRLDVQYTIFAHNIQRDEGP